MDNATFVRLKNNFKTTTDLDADKNMEVFMQYVSVIYQRENNAFLKHIGDKISVIEDSLRTLSQKKL